jgi:hypothetical protein
VYILLRFFVSGFWHVGVWTVRAVDTGFLEIDVQRPHTIVLNPFVGGAALLAGLVLVLAGRGSTAPRETVREENQEPRMTRMNTDRQKKSDRALWRVALRS